ncbi:hypothetical protein FHS83_001845 [Rhizomicrobium palustre]|uniref:Serine dehydrogenase proteinase n=1 Tax=Rhizomicrobium palustre TaxID=189966 RepID=A0A846N017_9PROT|nr:hypothetical protein [Rhizomicrobium palustre]
MAYDPNFLVVGGAILTFFVLVFAVVRAARGRSATAADLRSVPSGPAVAPVSAPPLAMNLAGAPFGENFSSPQRDAAISIPLPRPGMSPHSPVDTGGRKLIAIVHDFGHPRDVPSEGRRYLTTREAFEILAEIRSVPADRPIDIVLHTPGGEAFACELIASALKDRPNTTTYVPYCAMSAGTIIALSTEKIVMGKFACLGPIDTQFYGFPIESYIRLLKEKPLAAVSDEIVLLGYLAEKEMKTARKRACELLNKSHFGQDDACQLTDFLVAGDMPHSEQISRERAIELGVNVVSAECPPMVYEMVEQRLRLFQSFDGSDGFGPNFQARGLMLGHRLPPASHVFFPGGAFNDISGMARKPAEAATAEIVRHLVNAAYGFIAQKIASHTPTKTQVRAFEAELRGYLKEAFENLSYFIDSHWKMIFEKILAAFPD